jgi:hypothetical protein
MKTIPFKDYVDIELCESVPYSITGEHVGEMKKKLGSYGFALDGADLDDLERNPKRFNGGKFTIYKMKGRSIRLEPNNAYTCTFNYYSDGGWEFISIAKA